MAQPQGQMHLSIFQPLLQKSTHLKLLAEGDSFHLTILIDYHTYTEICIQMFHANFFVITDLFLLIKIFLTY